MSLVTHDRGESRRLGVRRRPGAGRAAVGLTWVLTDLVAIASLVGLFVDAVYTGAESTAQMLRANDLVTVLVVVPGLGLALRRAARGSVMAHLVVASLVAYVVYTYAYYLFGTGFNDLFLLHTAIFSAGLVALGLLLASLDVDVLGSRFHGRTASRVVAGSLGVLGVALGGMWVYVALDNAVTGNLPAGSRLVETDAVVHLGMALDLTLLVPLYLAAAVLLWRRAPWGYVLAGPALFAGVLHQVSYVVAMPLQVAADVPGAVSYDPGEPVIVLLYLAASALLIHGARRPGPLS